MNTYLKYQPPTVQFLMFLTIAAGCFFISFFLSSYFFSDIINLMQDKKAVITSDSITKFKWLQFASAILSFVVPALLFGYYSSPKSLPYIGIQKIISPVLILAAIILFVCVQPLISWLGNMNEHINFGSLQKSIEAKEAMYDRVLKVFLQMHSATDLLINLFIMALLPAIAEELFFRGALQKILLRLSHHAWLAIVITSGIFALLHGTFFKLIPIFVLGIALGTVYHVTRNLWYTIIIHFINNSLAVLAVYYADRNETIKKLTDDNTTVPVYLAILSLVISISIIYFIKKKSDEVLPEVLTDEDNDYIAS